MSSGYPSSRNSLPRTTVLQNVHLLTERQIVPAATLLSHTVLTWWAEQARPNRSQTRICKRPLNQAAQDTAYSLSNTTRIRAYIHHAPPSQESLQISPKQGSKDREWSLSLPLHIHSHCQQKKRCLRFPLNSSARFPGDTIKIGFCWHQNQSIYAVKCTSNTWLCTLN